MIISILIQLGCQKNNETDEIQNPDISEYEKCKANCEKKVGLNTLKTDIFSKENCIKICDEEETKRINFNKLPPWEKDCYDLKRKIDSDNIECDRGDEKIKECESMGGINCNRYVHFANLELHDEWAKCIKMKKKAYADFKRNSKLLFK